MNSVNFAAIQMSVIIGDKNATIQKAEQLIDRAVKEYNPDIIGLPEFFNTEYFPQYMDRKYFQYAEPIPGPTTERIAAKAKEHRIHIIAPIYEKAARGVYYDSSPLIGPDGQVLSVTRKIELPFFWIKEEGTWSYEKFYYSSGSEFPVVKTEKGNIGQIICYNRHFPEQWRTLTSKGAEMLFIPVASMGRTLGEMFSLEMRVLSYIFQVFSVVVNRVGVEGEHKMYGGSHIVGPTGKLLAGPASAEHDEIICATLDLDEIDEARQKFPFTRDVKPEIYLEAYRRGLS